jgi:transposase
MAHRHNDDFKREAVRIALTSGLSRKQVASDQEGIGFSTLSKWVQTMRRDEIAVVPQEDLAKENERLSRQVRLLKEERDILKKATVFFAEQSK